MADITMCADDKCPNRMKCHRFTARVNEYRQALADFGRKPEEEKCDSFWDNEGRLDSK